MSRTPRPCFVTEGNPYTLVDRKDTWFLNFNFAWAADRRMIVSKVRAVTGNVPPPAPCMPEYHPFKLATILLVSYKTFNQIPVLLVLKEQQSKSKKCKKGITATSTDSNTHRGAHSSFQVA